MKVKRTLFRFIVCFVLGAITVYIPSLTHRPSLKPSDKNLGHRPSFEPSNTSNVFPTLNEFRKSHFMTIQGHGSRLGNQIFQFAALLGVSALNGYTPYISPSSRLPDLLETFDVDVTKRSDITNTKLLHIGKVGIYYKSVESLNNKFNWTLKGCFQSWRYFTHVVDLRKRLKIKKHILQEARKIMADINISNKTVIGVHIRRGDFNTPINIREGFTVASKEYVEKAMAYCEKHYRNPIFIIASDDLDWCRQNLKADNIKVLTNNTVAVHFAILTMANHSIITAGTYGWMAGYIAGGDVVYLKDFPRKGSYLETFFDRNDYYPSHWIGME